MEITKILEKINNITLGLQTAHPTYKQFNTHHTQDYKSEGEGRKQTQLLFQIRPLEIPNPSRLSQEIKLYGVYYSRSPRPVNLTGFSRVPSV